MFQAVYKCIQTHIQLCKTHAKHENISLVQLLVHLKISSIFYNFPLSAAILYIDLLNMYDFLICRYLREDLNSSRLCLKLSTLMEIKVHFPKLFNTCLTLGIRAMLFSKGIIHVFCCTAAQQLDNNKNCSSDINEITCFLKKINLQEEYYLATHFRKGERTW